MIARTRVATAVTWRMTNRHARPAIATLLLGVGIIAAMCFGGNGMSAHDVVGAMRMSWTLRAALWSIYFLLALPAARAVLLVPNLFYLRSLAVRYADVALAQVALLALVELPWIALHALGGNTLEAVAAFAAMLTGHLLSVRASWLSPVALACAVLNPWLGAALLVTLPFLLSDVWHIAPALPQRERRTPRRLSIAHALALVLWRTRKELFARAALFCALCIACARLAIAHSPWRSSQIGATAGWWWACIAVSPCIAALEAVDEKQTLVLGRTRTWPVLLTFSLIVSVEGAFALGPFGMAAALIAAVMLWLSHVELEHRAPRDAGQRIIRTQLLLAVGTAVIWW